MNQLSFEVAGAEADRYAAVPTLNVRLHVSAGAGADVHALSLRCQIRIEPQRRRYTRAEEERLLGLFGETPRWGDTLRPFLWAHASAMVPGFVGFTEVDLPVPCTYDFEVAAAKYMHSLDDGEIPLVLLFNGTAFGRSADGALRVDPVPWHCESTYRLPVAVWRAMMDLYFPNQGWLRLPRHTLDALERYKSVEGLATMEQAVEALLKAGGP
ncbi:MAG TPA: DUF6084 family protein [Acidimicrobiales bacterium]|jgi:hypothetical protein|nr:DUF6084 family protein [Acidimicrobiales bacterium]